MNNKSGSTIIFITFLCFIVLTLGALVAWQYHRQEMEKLVLENLSLKQKIEDVKKDGLLKEDQEASSSSQSAQINKDLDFLENSATLSATGSAF